MNLKITAMETDSRGNTHMQTHLIQDIQNKYKPGRYVAEASERIMDIVHKKAGCPNNKKEVKSNRLEIGLVLLAFLVAMLVGWQILGVMTPK